MKLFFKELSRFHKQIIAATVDLFMLPLAVYMAISLRYDGVTYPLFMQYVWVIVCAPLISIPIFIRLGLYRAVIRFLDQKIVVVVVWGMTFSVLLLSVLAFFTTHMQGMSRGVFIMYWVGGSLYVVVSRYLVRGYFMQITRSEDAQCVAIYGAGRAGSQLANALRAEHEYIPVAFIDDKKELEGATVAGIKVYSINAMSELIARKGIKEVLLAMPSITRSQQKRILDRLEAYKVKIKVTPPIGSLLNGELRAQDVRDIEIEDLLGRDTVDPDMRLIASCITDKSVMVTGAGGSIGAELCRQIIRLKPSRLILLDMSEFALYSIKQELRALNNSLESKVELLPFLGSVADNEKCKKILTTFSVETVYHAAAYKHVPLVEHNPIEGIRNNVFGTLSIAQAAVATGVKCFVLISTDKAVRPTNVMGSTKRFAELILQALSREQNRTRFCMVRFGNVLGSSGSVVPLFRKQIMEGGPVTVTHPEITRYFMTIPEAAQLVLQAGAMGEGGDVFVLDMGEPVKIMDLARRMVHLSGLEVKGESTDGTIEIQHIGLRPGEKLYEELLIGDNVEGTEHPLIMRAQEKEIAWPVLYELLMKMENACSRADYEEMRALLMQAVDEYQPQCGIEDYIWAEKSKKSELSADITFLKRR
ncbi:MAG TPA: nucleoside-diphosphate sugar epimerase/dehydratase [Burkholderiaceae bacterium]|jgi:FlaA1/EpsC-like NDP-sugar epimerase